MTLTLDGNGTISGLGDIDGHDLETNTLVNISDATFAAQAVGRATLFIDASTNRVGINTTTPSRLLEISDNDPIVAITDTANSVDVLMGVFSGNAFIGTESSDRFDINAGGGARITVLSNGNVGINTTTPTTKLEVEDVVTSTTQFSGFQALRLQNAYGATFGGTVDLNFVVGTSSANRGACIGALHESPGGNALYFATNPNAVTSNDTLVERMRIDSQGRVAIDTTEVAPNVNLWVNSPGEGTVFPGLTYSMVASSDLAFDSGVAGAGLNFVGEYAPATRTSFALMSGKKENLTSGDFGGTLVFATRVNSGNMIECARFTSSQNLAFPNGQGIQFDAAGSGSTSTLLDAYEEGTFTPVIGTINGNSFNTYTTQPAAYGNYVKVGELVYVQVYLTGPASGAASTTDSVGIGNLPFVTATNNSSGYSPVTCWPYTFWDGTNIANGAQLISRTQVGRSFVFLQKITQSGGAAGVVSSDLLSTLNLMLSVSYIAV